MKSKFDNLLKTVRGEEPPEEPTVHTAAKSKPARKASRKVTTPARSLVSAQSNETKRRGRPPAKHSDPDYVQATAYIKKVTHRDVKIELLKVDPPFEFSELVEQLLANWLKNRR